MSTDIFSYRFEKYLYPEGAHCTRVEIEKGRSPMDYIRQHPIELAKRLGQDVLVYVYNDYLRRWEFIARQCPDGSRYDFNGNGPTFYDPKLKGFYPKEGGDE